MSGRTMSTPARAFAAGVSEGGAGGSGLFGEGRGQIAQASQVKMLASAIDRTSRPGKIPAYWDTVNVMTGTTVMQIRRNVSGSCAFAWARPAKIRNSTRPMQPNSRCGTWLSNVVKKNANQADKPITT